MKMGKTDFDVIVIGTGPAGLTGGIFTTRRDLETLILGDPSSLSQTEEAAVIDDYPGFEEIMGIELIKKFREHAKRLGADVRSEKVVKLEETKGGFLVKTDEKGYSCKAIIIATGARYRKARVPGESEFVGRGVSYCASCDAPMYKGKKVIVIGGGDSAVTEALLLDHVGAEVTLVHRRDQLRAVESLQKKLMKSRIKKVWDTVIVEIRGDKFVKSALLRNVKTKKDTEIPIDGVFIAIGTVPTAELAKDLGVKLNDSGFIIIDKGQKTNIEGVFAAGDCCDNPSKKIATAVGDGAVAADSAYDYIKEKE